MIDVSLISLGCPKNLVDSENILGLLDPDRYRFTPQLEQAEIIIINTCAFIAPARRESSRQIAEAAAWKKGRCRRLIVTGCLVQYFGEEITELFPATDIFIGVGEYNDLPAIIEKSLAAESPPRIIRREIPVFPFRCQIDRRLAAPSHYAYLRIADGCDNRCSYCLIPSLRGPYQPRDLQAVVLQAEQLAESGVGELILVAQDTSYYGSAGTEGGGLSRLLSELVRIPNIQWVRILYAHPAHLGGDVLEMMAASDLICNYLDLPVQHISDRILKLMGRSSGRDQIENIISRARELVPGISLRTTVMTGFPGERDEDFRELEEFVRRRRFDHLGVFMYSPEAGTPAARLSGRVEPAVAEFRRNRLMEIQQGISAEKLRDRVGTEEEVIVDGAFPEKDSKLWVGRTRFQAPEIDGLVVIEGEGIAPGDMIKVKLTSSSEYDLYGVRTG